MDRWEGDKQQAVYIQTPGVGRSLDQHPRNDYRIQRAAPAQPPQLGVEAPAVNRLKTYFYRLPCPVTSLTNGGL